VGAGGTRDRGDAAPLVIAVAIGVAFAVAALRGDVRDLGTAGSLSSVLALPIMAAIFYAARLLQRRMRRARVASLRREDRRDRAHVLATINMCRSLALGARGSIPGSPAAMSAMRDIALHMGDARTAHERLFTAHGLRLADRVHNMVHNMALNSIRDRSCAPADLAHILHALKRLEPEVLGIDDGALAGLREREAGAGDPGPE